MRTIERDEDRESAGLPLENGGKGATDVAVDEAGEESFPASDPPAWTVAAVGGPDHRRPGVRDDGKSGADAVTVSRATLRDLDELVELLQANEAPRGSLTGHFTRERVEAAIQAMPVIVARLDGHLVGVLVSSPIEAVREQPVLERMLAVYRGGPGAYIYGPVCVAEAARGHGVARMLFEHLKGELAGREGILFIRKDNTASLQAHQRLVGMRVRGEFSADDVAFVVLSFAG